MPQLIETVRPRFGRADILYLVILLVSFAGEFWLLSYRDSIEVLRARIPDEALFFDAMAGFRSFFETHEGFPTGFPGPYGHPFWLFLTGLVAFEERVGLPVVQTATATFLAMKYAAALFGHRLLRRVHAGWPALILGLAVFCSPGLYFFGKVISPEYMLLLACVAGTALLLGSAERGEGAALTAFFIAAYTKVLTFPYFAVALGLALTRDVLRRRWFHAGARAATTVAAAAVIVAISGGFWTLIHSITALPTSPFDSDPSHALQVLTAPETFTWDQVPVVALLPGFPVLLAASLAGVAALCARRPTTAMIRDNADGIAMLGTSAAILIVLTGKSMVWSWYVFVPAVVASLTMMFLSARRLPPWMFIVGGVASLLIGAPNAIHAVRTEWRTRAIVAGAERASPELLAHARALCGPDPLVIFDALLPIAGDARTRVLSQAVTMPLFKNAISASAPYVVVSPKAMFTTLLASQIVLPAQLRDAQVVPGEGRLVGYQFALSPACRPASHPSIE